MKVDLREISARHERIPDSLSSRQNGVYRVDSVQWASAAD